MAASTTLTVRLSPKLKTRLRRLADQTDRTSSCLVGEAIADFVERELAIAEGVKRGLDDMHAGRVTPHKDAMRRLRATAMRGRKTKT